MVEIRHIAPGEYELARGLWDACFPEDASGYSEWYFKNKTKREFVLAAFENGEMLSALHAIPYGLSFSGKDKRCAMIAGVATLPARRHEGLAGALIRSCHEELRSAGVCAAVLKPDVDFYAQFGYLPFAWHDEYFLTRAMAAGMPKAELHSPSPDEMLAIYGPFAARYEGMMLRSAADMETALEETALFGFAACSEGAYALCFPQDNGVYVQELAGNSPLPLVAALAEEYGGATFRLPRGTGLPGLLPERAFMFSMLCPLDEGALVRGTGAKSAAELLSRNCSTLEFC